MMGITDFQCGKIAECLVSPAVQVQLPVYQEQVQAKLSAAEVTRVFTDHVPGVQTFLFRQQRGQCVLKFVQLAYQDGWSAFRGTDIQDHLKSLMRLIVHHGHEGKPGAAQYLTEVAEAFMDCQAVQARVVERIGLQIRGVTADFRGLVIALVGEYKTVALKMLAAERISQGKAYDDATPTHYENRLTADLGQELGMNASDVRRASLDEHAQVRFAKLGARDVHGAVVRARELFDVHALLQALVSELNSFCAESTPDSLPRLFLDWASENMTDKHIVFDEETCTHVEVDCALAMAVLEILFLGQTSSGEDVMFRGRKLCDLFGMQESAQPAITCTSVMVCNEPADNATAIACTSVMVCNQPVENTTVMIDSPLGKKQTWMAMGLMSLITACAAPLTMIETLGSLFLGMACKQTGRPLQAD
jgi:hypothetical protein